MGPDSNTITVTGSDSDSPLAQTFASLSPGDRAIIEAYLLGHDSIAAIAAHLARSALDIATRLSAPALAAAFRAAESALAYFDGITLRMRQISAIVAVSNAMSRMTDPAELRRAASAILRFNPFRTAVPRPARPASPANDHPAFSLPDDWERADRRPLSLNPASDSPAGHRPSDPDLGSAPHGTLRERFDQLAALVRKLDDPLPTVPAAQRKVDSRAKAPPAAGLRARAGAM